jgi:hypothetical protein
MLNFSPVRFLKCAEFIIYLVILVILEMHVIHLTWTVTNSFIWNLFKLCFINTHIRNSAKDQNIKLSQYTKFE